MLDHRRPDLSDEAASAETTDPPRTLAARVGVAVAMVALGALLATSARLSPQTDEVRLGRGVELIELIRSEQERNAALAERAAELSAQLDGFQRAASTDATVAELTARVEDLALAAGLAGVQGPGVVVTLADATSIPAGADVNDHIIHEEDLQAVINALWAGGAEALSVNGQRILATTAIRCVGNTLLLHGQTYPPPYVIAAVGDEPAMRLELSRDVAVERFDRAVAAYGLGFTTESAEELVLSTYEGPLSLNTARPVTPLGRG